MQKALRILAIAVLTLIPIAVIADLGTNANHNDFVEYWSAGKLFVEGANPYSGPAILAIEKSRGFAPADPLIMLNPPWIMPLVAPLGFLPAVPALVFWIVACAACLGAAVVLLGLPANLRGPAFLFAPVLGSFMMEQSSPFLLLGLALFLRFHRHRPWLAGASLTLMALKPHLFLVFWVLLAADGLYRRTFRIFAGFAASLACVSALVTLRAPHIWQDYLTVLRTSTLGQNSYPTLPSLIRESIDVNRAWIALVPSAIAILWGLAYYWRRRAAWDWRREGMPILVVSILSSPYSWISDQILLLPPVASALASSPRRYAMAILIGIDCLGLLGLSVAFRSLLWLPLVLAIWYWYAVSRGMSVGTEEQTARYTADS